MSALKHDVDEPDLLCLGDDPCVCLQLRAARRQTLEQALSLVDKDQIGLLRLALSALKAVGA